jgi:hypothetical protein
MAGEFEEFIAVVPPEKPVRCAVLKVPLMVAVPDAPPHVIEVVPVFKVDPAATVRASEAPLATVTLFVFNKLPELTLPTDIFPVTLVAVTPALNVAPLALVLLMLRLAYVTLLTAIGIVCAAGPLKLKVLVVPGVSVPTVYVKAPPRFKVPAPPDISITFDALLPVTITKSPEMVSVPVVIAICAMRLVFVAIPANVTFPPTVDDPALIFQAVVAPPVGRLIVTLFVTVKALVPVCVSELEAPLAANVKLLQVLLLLIV